LEEDVRYWLREFGEEGGKNTPKRRAENNDSG